MRRRTARTVPSAGARKPGCSPTTGSARNEAADEAARAVAAGAKRVCLVASGRGRATATSERVARTIGAIRAGHPELEVCVCLRHPGRRHASRLKEAGADAYNHNLNTAPSNYGSICSTHSFEDRVGTVRHAAGAGLSPCSGVIVGMGESDDELVDVAFGLTICGPTPSPSISSCPFEGTPWPGTWTEPGELPAGPGHVPFRFPRRRSPHRRGPGDAPAQPAASGPAHRQFHLPRRLPHLRRRPGAAGPGR